MKRLLFAIMLIFLVGCGSAVEETAVSQVTDVPSTQVVATDLPPTATIPSTPTMIPTTVSTDLPPTEAIVEATLEPTLTMVPTTIPTEEPAIPTEEPMAMFGRTPEGALYIGRSNADITLIDYSDFL